MMVKSGIFAAVVKMDRFTHYFCNHFIKHRKLWKWLKKTFIWLLRPSNKTNLLWFLYDLEDFNKKIEYLKTRNPYICRTNNFFFWGYKKSRNDSKWIGNSSPCQVDHGRHNIANEDSTLRPQALKGTVTFKPSSNIRCYE